MEMLLAFGSALWLGIMTSISPCPLAANIAAVSFISKRITHPFLVFLSGLAYTAGRMIAYAGLGFLVLYSMIGIPQVAQFLQKYMPVVLGPVFIITGCILLEIIKINLPGLSLSHKQHTRIVEAGVPGAFVLGIIFGLAFCPVSAALFFGSLIPLSLNSSVGTLLPFVYGVGTGLPVLFVAVALALGVRSLSYWFQRITKVEYYTRKITGVIFIAVGAYYFFVYILNVF